MSFPKSMRFAGEAFKIIKPYLGQGGQGTVHKAQHTKCKDHLAIIKELPDSTENRQRLDYCVAQGLGYQIPGLSAPLSPPERHRQQKIWYLAAYNDGHLLEDDQPRSLPQLLEIAVLLATIWQRLETLGIAHGDIAPSNIMVALDGWVDLIDIDNYASIDPSVPPPPMIGQHAMLAPELRIARNQGQTGQYPDIYSDRFSWGILFNILLLGRHPADGVADNPTDFDRLMLTGHWLEDQRAHDSNEVPNSVLGESLMNLFRQACLVDPKQRPDAKTWRITLMEALKNLHTHTCHGSFVVEKEKGQCLYCQQPYISTTTPVLQVRNLSTGTVTEFDLKPESFVYLGRQNLKGLSRRVSSKQVRFYRSGQQLYLEHVGRNPTALVFAGDPKRYLLKHYQQPLQSPHWRGLTLILADTTIEIQLQT